MKGRIIFFAYDVELLGTDIIVAILAVVHATCVRCVGCCWDSRGVLVVEANS